MNIIIILSKFIILEIKFLKIIIIKIWIIEIKVVQTRLLFLKLIYSFLNSYIPVPIADDMLNPKKQVKIETYELNNE